MRRPALRGAAIVVRRALREFLRDGCMDYAGSIALHVLLSLFPLAILVVDGAGLVLHEPARRSTVFREMVGVLPLSAHGQAQLRDLLDSVTANQGAFGAAGLVALIWSSTGVMAGLRTGLNRAWDVEESRPFLIGKLVDLGLVAGAGLVFLASIGVTFLTDFAGGASDRLPGPVPLLAGQAFVALLLLAVVSFLYSVLPARRPPLRDVVPGALVAVLGFELLKNGFGLYLAHVGNYNAVYGTLGAVVVFLYFVYLSAIVLLFGAEVASELGRYRRRVVAFGARLPA